MSDPRLARPLWRGRTNVDALTIAAVERAESIGGHQFQVTQGSYQNTVAASAGTHDGGGAVDLAWCGHVGCVRALRVAGMAAWHRRPSQGPWRDHIHAVVVDHPSLSGSAGRQVVAYRAGRNGLANNGVDDGPRVGQIKPPVFPWPKPKTRGKKVEQALALVVEAFRSSNKSNPKSHRTRKLKAARNRLREIRKNL